jgi:hypothetical protein
MPTPPRRIALDDHTQLLALSIYSQACAVRVAALEPLDVLDASVMAEESIMAANEFMTALARGEHSE